MGGSEDTYQQSLLYLNHNHQPTVSHSFSHNPIKKAHDRIPPHTKQDPLENEYTRHSHTAETIDQSLLEKRESASYSNTWTHSQNQSNYLPQRSNKSNISTEPSDDHEEKKDEPFLIKRLKSTESLESDSRSDRQRMIDDIFNEKINEKTPCMNDTTTTTQDITIHCAKYAQDDVNNDTTNPIMSKKLFSKRKSDSFFMNNHNVIIPSVYHRKYVRKMNISHPANEYKSHMKDAENRNKEHHLQDWYQFSDDESFHHEIQSQSEQKQQRDTTHGGYQSRRKTRNRNRKNRKHNTQSNRASPPPQNIGLKPQKARKEECEEEEKQKERDRWKQNREQRGYHPDTSDVINSSAKVVKFFGDNPQSKSKVNWKIGASWDEIMRMRSLGLLNITEKDDKLRKKERNTFSRKTKFIEKLSQIKLKWGPKAATSRSSVDDIESTKFLSSSLSDVEDENPMNKTISDEIESDNNNNNPMIESDDDDDGENDAYHIDQSVFTFQNPYDAEEAQRKKYKDYTDIVGRSSSSRFLNKRPRKSKKKNAIFSHNKYGFKPNGKVNASAISEQIHGLRKLLSEKKTLSEIISIYYQQYGFCVEFIVYLIATIDETCTAYVSVISRHVDKQMKILHGLSIWQYMLRHQLPQLDMKRFFYSFGPLIGKYKTLISPLHLAARKLIEIGGGKESHITSTTSSPQCVYAFEIFKWLLFIGYDIDDGDVDNVITPQTILNHAPRIAKQILSYQRQFLFKQRQCMKAVDNAIYTTHKILL
eukprot:299631_1